jgi:hypothetical protein
MWIINRVDEILIGWNNTSTFESQKVTKLLVVGGDERKDLVNDSFFLVKNNNVVYGDFWL